MRYYEYVVKKRRLLSFTRIATHGKAHTSVAAQTLGSHIGDRRRAVGLTQEQLAEYLEIDTLTVSRYETGNTLPLLTVVDVVTRLLNTTIAELLAVAPAQPVEHAERIGILLASLPVSDRDQMGRAGWFMGITAIKIQINAL